LDAVVLDTNVVSYLMKGDSRPKGYQQMLVGKTLAISFMTVAELHEWACRRNWGEAKLRKLENVLRSYLVIPSSPRMCELWGVIRAERQHQPISTDDAWIAATAKAYGCALITHNPRDFENISGLEVLTQPD